MGGRVAGTVVGNPSHEPHPWLGNGLAVVLKLPRCRELAETQRLVNTLNWWEWCALDGPPVVGAWTCLPGKGEPIFVTLVPDEAWHSRRWVVNGWESGQIPMK